MNLQEGQKHCRFKLREVNKGILGIKKKITTWLFTGGSSGKSHIYGVVCGEYFEFFESV